MRRLALRNKETGEVVNSVEGAYIWISLSGDVYNLANYAVDDLSDEYEVVLVTEYQWGVSYSKLDGTNFDNTMVPLPEVKLMDIKLPLVNYKFKGKRYKDVLHEHRARVWVD